MTTIIPAQPDWYLVDLIKEDDGIYREFILEPVIAWAVQTERDRGNASYTVEPITIEGADPGNETALEDTLLCRPDGTFVVAFDRSFRTAAEMLEYYNQERAPRPRGVISWQRQPTRPA